LTWQQKQLSKGDNNYKRQLCGAPPFNVCLNLTFAAIFQLFPEPAPQFDKVFSLNVFLTDETYNKTNWHVWVKSN